MSEKSRGAAADIHHQDDFAGLDLFAESFAHRFAPRVERGLGFFEQRDIAAVPPCCAACSVRSRAAASNEAGTVSTTSCSASEASR